MAVHVDDVRHRFGNMVMCHLWADTEAELLAMVDKIGVARKWIQRPPKASWVHFDIALSKKALAIKAGAILTDQFGPLEHEARLDIASGDPQRIARGEARLERIAFSRGLRSA
jgi:hypothetical protein